MIPDDLMSSKKHKQAELRISPKRDKRNKGLIHLLKPTDVLERQREKEGRSEKLCLQNASLLSQKQSISYRGMMVTMQRLKGVFVEVICYFILSFTATTKRKNAKMNPITRTKCWHGVTTLWLRSGLV